MHALTVHPQTPDSIRMDDVAEPPREDGSILAEVLCVGICGTDREIIAGRYGAAPPGSERLVLGHESLARVVEAPEGCGFAPGDLVAGIVRRPDPVPCPSCAIGEWDMCRNGRYTERGIRGRDGFASERIRIEPGFAVRIDSSLGIAGVLTEPASVVAKAWEHIDRIGARFAAWSPRRALVTGAGPVGLLAALFARLRGLDVHVLDRATDGPKPVLVRDLGATYHASGIESLGALEPDVIVECTGASAVILGAIRALGPNGVLCLAGVSSGGHTIDLDLGGINRSMVLENHVIVGSVNANRRHYEQAAAALARADRAWLRRLVSRRVPVTRWREAFERRPGDVKVALEFGGAAE